MQKLSMHFIVACAAAFLAVGVISCGKKSDGPEPDPDPDPVVTPTPRPASVSFAKGADISWVSEMENGGVKFRTSSGTQADIFDVLKSTGMNSVRLRVFVDPSGGWSSKADMVKLAVRAKNAGMGIMVDFHYSDFFADPARQTPPSSWSGLSLEQMAAKVSEHTKDVMQALFDAGVAPNWVQVGNETRNGMLWDTGRLWTSSGDIPDGRKHFATLFNAGYEAAKSVFPDVLVMPHLDNAYDDNAWWFTQMKSNGMKFDMIALSHYPQADNTSHDWKWYNSQAVTRIKSLISTFGVPVVVSEVGIKLSIWSGGKTVDNTAEAEKCLSEFMTSIAAIDKCDGIFYWEPEVYGGWKPAVYKDVSKYVPGQKEWGSYEMGAFNSDGSPSSALNAFK